MLSYMPTIMSTDNKGRLKLGSARLVCLSFNIYCSTSNVILW